MVWPKRGAKAVGEEGFMQEVAYLGLRGLYSFIDIMIEMLQS